MKRRYRITVALAGLIFAAVWRHAHPSEPTVLAFRLGQTAEQIDQDSTQPMIARSKWLPAELGEHKLDVAMVKEPAVVIRFTDPKHGFTLPPTNFAAVTFSKNQVLSLATSPMLDPMLFEEAVALLEQLQNQFKAGGWAPWVRNDSTWFDLTPEGKKRLYARMFEPEYMKATNLRVAKMYGMLFRLQCSKGCETREPPYLFRIHIAVGNDYEADDPLRWRRSGAAAPGGGVR